MSKCSLSLLIGLAVSGAAFAQASAPPEAGAQNETSSVSTTTTDRGTQTTTTTTTTRHFSKPADALNEDQIRADIAEAGYKEVKDLEFKDGVWQTKARGGNRDWRKLKVSPVTGRVYPEDAPSRLDEDEVKAKLTAQGYTNIGHVKFDDGLWSADAETGHGRDVDLLVDPTDGSVIARSDD